MSEAYDDDSFDDNISVTIRLIFLERKQVIDHRLTFFFGRTFLIDQFLQECIETTSHVFDPCFRNCEPTQKREMISWISSTVAGQNVRHQIPREFGLVFVLCNITVVSLPGYYPDDVVNAKFVNSDFMSTSTDGKLWIVKHLNTCNQVCISIYLI